MCDRMIMGVLLWAVVHAGAAVAGDTFAPLDEPARAVSARFPPSFAATLLTVPPNYQFGAPPEAKIFSTQEFRPRGRSLLQRDGGFADDDAPMIHGTTVWQRLRDFRTRDRVRVVTLWETGGSSVSLQAGKKGDPSLQWTSRSMNRGGASRGLLDELLSTSFGSVGRGWHLSRPPKSLDAALAGGPVK